MALIGSLTSGVSALSAFSKNIETIGDNIANANTTGFKASTTRNEDSFSQTLENATSFSSTLQVGSGVNVATNRQNFTQGSLTSTGVSTDFGIAGSGFFMVSAPDNLGVSSPTKMYFERDGNFRVNGDGYLVNAQGYRVQGAGATFGTTAADVMLPNAAAKTAGLTLQSFTVGDDGKITEFYTDGTNNAPTAIAPTDNRQSINLWTFADPTSLSKVGGNLFQTTPAAGMISSTGGIPGTAAGAIKQGTLELSNVDLAQEFTDLITAQRSFQAGSRIITVSDSVLQEIVDLKRS